MWVPPGGHIEPHEVPDAAAIREVLEETGVRVRLIGEPQVSRAVDEPILLVRPEGIQLENIRPDHEHIDLIYYAALQEEAEFDIRNTDEGDLTGWYRLSELESMGVNAEVRHWSENASHALRQRLPESTIMRP